MSQIELYLFHAVCPDFKEKSKRRKRKFLFFTIPYLLCMPFAMQAENLKLQIPESFTSRDLCSNAVNRGACARFGRRKRKVNMRICSGLSRNMPENHLLWSAETCDHYCHLPGPYRQPIWQLGLVCLYFCSSSLFSSHVTAYFHVLNSLLLEIPRVVSVFLAEPYTKHFLFSGKKNFPRNPPSGFNWHLIV